ncbi:EpsG family protein [Vibrio fluvialis]|uniref:EpsG family protein n=1 Tax=Vibrio sp. bablab_jr001 TaxID=2755067 RepID=UPI0018F20EAD|nr:EpsG family protein [Vibrio sp. bablab_jr001]MBY7825780.1 EpsG family protein [Vibrio fluvialis]MBY8254304.1 EpsG family protein [Vibrio fluvialis]
MQSRIVVLYLYFLFSLSLILILAAGLRTGGDPDYANYLDIYLKSQTEAVSVEPFYLYLNKLFYKLNIPFEFLIFIIAFLSIGIKAVVFYKKSPYYLSSLLIYLFTIFVQFDSIAIRQGLAISLVMLAFMFVERKSLSIPILLGASLFHVSALIVLPMLFMVNIEYKKKLVFTFYSIVLIATLLKFSLPIQEYIFYFSNAPAFILERLLIYSSYTEASILSYKQLLILLISILVYFYCNASKFIKSMCILYWYGCIISILFSQIGDIAYRLKWYFFFSEAFFVPVFIYMVPLALGNYLLMRIIKAFTFFACLIVLYVLPCISFIVSIHERNHTLIF